jgi:hypothetical protein
MTLPPWARALESGLSRLGRIPGTQANFLASTPVKSRRLLYAAAFFTFSSLGFIVDVMRPDVQAPFVVMLSALLTGLTAVLFIYVAAHHPRWFPPLLVVMLAVPFVNAMLQNQTGAVPFADASPLAIRVKLLVDGIGCLLGFVLSYTFFMGFIGAEGTRHARVLAEIELAGEIHRLLVPAVEQHQGRFELYGLSVPSTEVGGDLVDVVPTAGGWVGYVADVTGHGVGAGLLMAILKSSMRTRVLSGGGLDDVLGDVNGVLVPLRKPNMFVTLAALVDDGSGSLAFSVAGHPPILHYRAATGAIDELSVAQVPLGIFEERAFAFARVTPRGGDLLAIVTDGLTEVFDRRDDEFGLERLKDAIRTSATQPLKTIAETVMRLTREHGPQSDDQTLLLVRVNTNLNTNLNTN